jgi:photosystem II stability/assembly factor-like uncharacterized protein
MRDPVRPVLCLVLTLALLFATGGPLGAQEESDQTSASERLVWYADHMANAAMSRFRNLPWQFVGPTNISGRMTDVAVVTPKGDNYTIYVAGASGGVWRSRNEGVSWEPIFEHAASTSIGDVTLAASDQNIVWVGTGEANIFRSSMAGAGVYKSTDGGDTWEHKGLGDTHTIPRIQIHPTNPDIVYVAASGHEWTENPDRGIYKTTDGGETWEKIFYRDERTGVIELVMHPTDPETLYAATWQRIRKAWNDPRNEADSSGSAIYKTTDGGATWAAINEGLPEPQFRGRIGLDIARSKPNVVYAFIDSYETAREPEEDDTDAYGRPAGPVIRGATVYRSDDGGESWRRTSEYNDYMLGLGGTYGWVFGQITVDPTNEDKIYVMGLALNVSEDGGKTFKRLTGMHGDHHGLWIDPDNPDYLANVNDGGLAISYDGGDNWRTFYDNLPLVQFFNVAHDMGDPMYAYGSIQDHGSRRGMIDLSRGRHAIPAVEWENAPGGEGSNQAIDPTDPNIVYAAGFYGSIFRADLGMDENTQLMPRAEDGEPPYRGQWLAPFIISPHNPRVIYLGLNKLFRSMNRGDSWEVMSDDLTHNDLDKIGDIQYQTIYSISESPFEFGLLYVGTDDGRVWTTDDSAGGWAEITGELPQGKFIAELVASRWDPDTVYAAQNGKRDDDFRPYLWKSTDKGGSWIDLAANIPSGPINVIKEDPKNPDVMYVGTDIGVYVSIDGGEHWEALPNGMPNTFVHDIVINPENDILLAATHGRGVYALDVRPIQQLSEEVRSEDLHMFQPDDVLLRRARFGFSGARPSAAFHIWMAEAGDYDVKIENADGEVVRTLSGEGIGGHNMVVWDLAVVGEGRSFGGRRFPPTASVGSYRVTVEANGASASVQLELEGS